MTSRYFLPLLATSVLALAACGDAAPPESEDAAVATVPQPNAGAAVNPETPAMSGGPAGQTPDYGQAGGAPAMVESAPDGAPPSVSNDNAPLP